MASNGLDMVQVHPKQDRFSKQERRDGYKSRDRSNALRSRKHRAMLEYTVADGGLERKGQAAKGISRSVETELDGMAVCSAFQLSICAAGTESPRSQFLPHRVELLPELSEQLTILDENKEGTGEEGEGKQDTDWWHACHGLRSGTCTCPIKIRTWLFIAATRIVPSPCSP